MSSRRWAFNLAPERPKDDIVKPVGFVDDSKLLPERARREEERAEKELKLKAISWKGNFIMYGMLLFLIPNSPSIYTISFAFIALLNPLRSAISFNNAFKQFANDIDVGTLAIYKVIYVLGYLLFAGVACYKMMKLGFLPTSEADWIYFYGVSKVTEQAHGGAALS